MYIVFEYFYFLFECQIGNTINPSEEVVIWVEVKAVPDYLEEVKKVGEGEEKEGVTVGVNGTEGEGSFLKIVVSKVLNTVNVCYVTVYCLKDTEVNYWGKPVIKVVLYFIGEVRVTKVWQPKVVTTLDHSVLIEMGLYTTRVCTYQTIV